MAKEEPVEHIVNCSVKLEGNAAKLVREEQAKRLLIRKPNSVQVVVKKLLCELYNIKNKTNEEC